MRIEVTRAVLTSIGASLGLIGNNTRKAPTLWDFHRGKPKWTKQKEPAEIRCSPELDARDAAEAERAVNETSAMVTLEVNKDGQADQASSCNEFWQWTWK